MGRRKKKRIISKRWKNIYFDVCPHCNGVPQIETLCHKDDLYFDGELAKCSQCGLTGEFHHEKDSFKGGIDWHLEIEKH